MRVNVQLIDGESGAHLWAVRFEDSITLQDQIVARLANSLGYELAKAETQKGVHSTNPDAIDLMMRGWAAHWRPVTKESVASAHDYFERAMKIDADSAEAMIGFAYAEVRASYYGWAAGPEDTYARVLDLVDKATAISPDYASAYYVKSNALQAVKRLPEALEAAQKTVTLDPNAAYGYSAMSFAETWLGHCEQSLAHTKQAFALSPRDPLGGLWHTFVAGNEQCLGHLDAAIGQYKQALDAGNWTYSVYTYLASAESAKGNDAAAQAALAEARRLNPRFTVKWYLEHWPPPLSGVVESWRKAGLPEE
jgi:tetratricopeptide (TPR) repeat protein